MSKELDLFIAKFSIIIRKMRESTAYLMENASDPDLSDDDCARALLSAEELAQYFSVGLIVERFLEFCQEGNILSDFNVQEFSCSADEEEGDLQKRYQACGLSFNHYSFRDTIEDAMRNMIVTLRDDVRDESDEPVFSDDELDILSTGRRLFLYSYRGAIHNQMKPIETASAFEGLCSLDNIQDQAHPYDQQQSMLDNEYFVFEKYFEKYDYTRNSRLITVAPRSAVKWVKQKYQEPQPVAAKTIPFSLN